MCCNRNAAFAFIELYVVMFITLLLLLILLPVFSAARSKARQATCLSNLKRNGASLLAYCQDFDERLPHGGDPMELQSGRWAKTPFAAEARTLTPLPELLRPYINLKWDEPEDLWRCRADNGYSISEFTGEDIEAQPTSYKKFGSSYLYRTELTLRHKTTQDRDIPYLNLLSDASGKWHGGRERRYTVVLGDGRAKSMDRASYFSLWAMELEKPAAPY